MYLNSKKHTNNTDTNKRFVYSITKCNELNNQPFQQHIALQLNKFDLQ